MDVSPLFKACEKGDSGRVETLIKEDNSKLREQASDGRTCLHAVVSRGDKEMLQYLLKHIQDKFGREREDLLKKRDRLGNTVLHLAVMRNRLIMVKRLVEFERGLASSQNNDNETAIYVAVKLGFLPVVEELVSFSLDSIEITSKDGKNTLHLAVELSQFKTLKLLLKNKKDLSQLINQPDETPKDNTQDQEDGNQSRGDTPLHIPTEINNVHMVVAKEDGNKKGGDTPLHIAARNKNVYMVELLLKVRGVNKEAVNSAGLTPLDIARENTEYYESYKIIEKLSDYPPKCRPFLYSAPTMSLQKKKNAEEMLDKIFDDRRNVELVVAVLLATMTFQAVFTVPGGFNTESSSVLGMPVLIGYESFKLFLVFDCLAFFLSLFVVLMWEMSTPFTARDKMLFIYLTNLAVCSAFAFTSFSLMAAVYTVLVHKSKTFAAVVLGSSMLIVLCGTGAFIYIAAKFTVRRARFHSLCGVPRLLDDSVETVWVWAEKLGILDAFRLCDDFLHGLISGDILSRKKGPNECGGGDKVPPTCQPQLEAEHV